MNNMKDVLYIIIPAYNEEETIKSVISDWYPIVEKHDGDGRSRLVVVDDGSRDATPHLLDEEESRREMMKVIHKANGGHGQAILTGYRYAIENGADFVFQTDSDGQTIPAEFEPFWRQRNRFAMVIGHRSARQDGLGRIFVTRALRTILLLSFRTWIKDANTPFRLMKAGILKESLEYLEEGETLTNVMISAVFARRKKRVLYRQITFRPRQGGTNSINFRKISRIGLDALERFRRLDRKLTDGCI